MKKSICVMMAHADDIEISVGGTLAKYISKGYRALYGVLTRCNSGWNENATEGGQYKPSVEIMPRRRAEAEAARIFNLEGPGGLAASLGVVLGEAGDQASSQAASSFFAIDPGSLFTTASLKILIGFQFHGAGLELGVLVPLAEIAFHTAVGKRPKFRPAIDRLDVAKVVAHHPQQLLHVPKPKMVHEQLVDFRGTLVLDRNPIVPCPLKRTKYTFSGVHGTASRLKRMR